MNSGQGKEFHLIEKIRKNFSYSEKKIPLGIGDDCAILNSSTGKNLLVSTDLLVEGVHFDLNFCTPFQLGWKSLAVNLSDIAAMGGTPLYFLVSFALPNYLNLNFITGFYRGIKTLARKYQVALIGGDTSSSIDKLFISLTVIGEAENKKSLKRKNARIGEKIYVTGTLGDSAAGLEVLKKSRAKKNYLTSKHVQPIPRLKEGKILADEGIASAMTDLSDGLASGIKRICEESKTGARIFLKNLPLSPSLKKNPLTRAPEEYALYGGEDYELLFTQKKNRSVGQSLKLKKTRTPVTEIGEITRKNQGVVFIDAQGNSQPIIKEGYAHL